MLPIELLKKIIHFTISHHGLDDVPAQANGGEFFHQDWLRDRRALGQVCSSFRDVVAEITAEYVIITHRRDLEWIVVQFKCSVPGYSTNEQTQFLIESLGGPPVSSGSNLGHWTKRIDLRIVGGYDHSLIPILLEHTPNLLVFLVQNKGIPNSTLISRGRLPRETLAGLFKFSKRLECLRLESYNEAPTLRDICDISASLPGLVTLQLTYLYGFSIKTTELMNLAEDQVSSHLIFPSLTTLSIGATQQIGPAWKAGPEFLPAWDLLLGALSRNSDQLPRLKRIELSFIPFSSAGQNFFNIHASKIRRLTIPTFACLKNNFTNILTLCSQLETVILIHWVHHPAPDFPMSHPSLRRICLVAVTNLAQCPQLVGLHDGVTGSIDELLQHLHRFNGQFPHLHEVWIEDAGIWEGALDTLKSRWSSSWSVEIRDREGRPLA
ncbi:hypothetical protein H1R20_g6568, partial [Candolleomyces eurysporus]